MKKIFILLLFTIGLFQFAIGQNSVFTNPPLAGGNGSAGVTFNLRTSTTILLDSIYTALYGTLNSSTNLTVWYHPNPVTAPPTISVANGWTQHVVSAPVIVGQTGFSGTNLINSAVPMSNLLMPAGSIWGFYIGAATGATANVVYTSHVASSIDTFTNGTITIYTGPNAGYGGGLPSPNFHPRQLNGGVSYLPAAGLDLRPSLIVAPTSFNIGSNLLTVRAQNSAADPIFSATMGYQIDNNPPVVVPTVNFSPTITVGNFQDYTFSTPINIPAAGTYTLKTWTTNVNGLGPDNNPGNDTLTRTICTGLSGTYTVGSPTSNFPTINDAVSALGCGLTGPINFLIEPGTYVGNYTIQNVLGSGFANPITFSSLTGLASDVVLVAPTASANKNVFTINGTTNVNFIGLTFLNNAAPTADGGLLIFGAGSHNAAITGCEFIDSTSSNSTFSKGIRFNSSNSSFLSGNSFNGFYYATFYAGTSATDLLLAPTISNNLFENYRYSTVYFTNVSEGIISDNTITDFTGTTAFSGAFYLLNIFKTSIHNNQVLGGLPGYGLAYISNFNGSEVEPNLIYNNVYSGTTAQGITSASTVYGMYIFGSFSATVTANNPLDYIEITNNTFNIGLRTTSTSTLQSFLYISGGSVATPAISKVLIRNNIFNGFSAGNAIPNLFRTYYLGNTAVRDSLISNRNGSWLGSSATNYYNVGGTNYTLAAWSALTNQDLNSLVGDPFLAAPNFPVPANPTYNNIASVVPYVITDVLGTPRNPTTPDPGAYEFNAAPFPSIVYSPLANTTSTANRTLVATITDSIGLTTTGQNSPRLYYRKSSTGPWIVDSNPTVSGNSYTFTFDYTQFSPSGVAQGDSLFYYVAASNSVGGAGTNPIGGGGLNPVGADVPPSLNAYVIQPSLTGTYKIGVSGPADFPTITAAAGFYNAGLVTGNVTFLLIDSLYTNETFPIIWNGNSAAGPNNTTTLKPDTGVNARVQGNPLTNALFVLNNPRFFTIDGSNNGTNSRNLSFYLNGTADSRSVVHLSTLSGSIDTVTIKNTIIRGGNRYGTLTFALSVGGTLPGTASNADQIRGLTIENNVLQKAYYGIYLRSTALMDSVLITNNIVGNQDTVNTITFGGIYLFNGGNRTSIFKNTITDIRIENNTGTNVFAIDLNGAGNGVKIQNNYIKRVYQPSTGGWGAWGINLNGGNDHLIANNSIADLRTTNYSSTSNFYNAFGIRISTGSGHKIYYNSINMVGSITTSTSTFASSALLVVGTASTNLDIRNNIFANTQTATGSVKVMTALWFPDNYPFSGTTINNNAYFVGSGAEYHIGRRGTTAAASNYFTDLTAWRTYSQTGNVNNDVASVPPSNFLPPFTNDTLLSVPASTATPAESGSVVIASLGTPNRDILDTIRPAFGGSAPDMGAYEFQGASVGDIQPPTIDSIVVTPLGSQCNLTSRTVTAYLKDNDSGLDSVYVFYTVGTGTAVSLPMTLSSGTVLNGVYTATIPASPTANTQISLSFKATDSAGNSTPVVQLGNWTDEYITANAGNDTTINLLDTATLVANVVGFGVGGSLQASQTAGTSCGGGFMTDITVGPKPLKIDGFTIWPTATGTQTVEVFYKLGSKSGNQNNQAAWTSAGSYTVNAATASLQFMPINGFVVQANTAYAIYLNYNNQYATGTTTFSNSDLSIGAGEGLCTPWTACCDPRVFAGAIHYSSVVDLSWRAIGNTSILSLSDTFLVSPPITTTYVLTATDSTCFVTDTVTVFVNSVQAPDIQVTRLVNPTQGTVVNNAIPITVDLKNVGTQPIGGFNVGYSVNGATVQTSTYAPNINPGDSVTYSFTPNWQPTQGGSYDICVFVNGVVGDLNPTNDTLCVNVSSTVNVENIGGADLISRIYPNPAGNQMFVEFKNNLNKGNLNIYNGLGQSVLKLAINGENSGTRQTLDLSSLADGVYFLQISTDAGEQTMRFQVIK